MSLNLYFETKLGSYQDFPFQTPTSLTMACVAAKTPEERIKLVAEKLREWKYEENSELLQRCEEMLKDPSLTLTYL